MIDHVDTLLSRLFRWQVIDLTAEAQVRFQPPDEDWRSLVPNIFDASGNHANSLNVYLADLRENRKLRTNERDRTVIAGDVYETPAARRVDCHYLISAWSPAMVTPGFDPTQEEHALLADVAHVLGQHDPLDPATICAAQRLPGLLPIAVPPPLVDELLPVTLLPVEGFPKIAEFWGTMGDNHRWKPCVYAVVTIPLKDSPVRAGAIVTTTITDALQTGTAGPVDTRYHIGGTVLDAAVPAQPVGNAWVELLNNVGNVRIQLTRSDSLGRFVFADVPFGAYQLRASAHPQGISVPRPITVPEPTGNYDIGF